MTENLDATDPGFVTGESMSVRVSNLGGIEDTTLEFDPGITILTGRNATNRTSLLRAIAGGFGGTSATLKSDADSGYVELGIGDETYRREYERRGKSVTTDGSAYTDRSELVDAFACLLEGNPARRTVEQGGDLRDVLMGPVDTESVKRELRQVDGEIDRTEREIERIESRKDRLPALERRKAENETELSDLEAEIEAVEAEIDSFDADESAAREAETVLEELEEAKSRRRRTEQRLDRQREKVADLREELAEREDQLAETSVPEDRLSTVRDEIDRLKERKRGLEDDVASLTEVIGFNDDLLSGDGPDVVSVEGDVTAQLDPSSRDVECWTCGSEVELGRISDRLDGLREILSEKRERRDGVQAELSDLESERRDLERQVDTREDLERAVEDLEREIDHREEKAEDLESTLDEIDEEVEAIQTRVEETEDLQGSELADAYERRNDLEYERGQVKQRLADVEAEIAEIESELEELDALRAELSEYEDRRTELRTYIEDLERETVERFNDHMEEVLSILEYDNVERVWIERVGKADTGDRAAERFELHVVRESADGAGYEDEVGNLSESERETIGLVVGLVGYLVHEVYHEVPIMLLDSLEAIDADRIARLVEYFSAYAPHLVVALLPEDEQAIATEHDRVSADHI